MFLKEDTFLKPFKKITLNQEEQKKYDASYKHFIDNRYKFFYLYNSSLFGFMFKKKRNEFLNKTSYFEAVSAHNALYRAYKMAELIAKEEYSVNAFSHYKFLIDGKEEIFGIFEIHPCIFYTAKILKSKIEKQKKEEDFGVIVKLNTNFQEKKHSFSNLDIPNNVIPFN